LSEYYKLGQVIRSYRLAADKSIEDLSGAVEVDAKFITDLEKGQTKPPEDILALIINHLDIEETEADELWELAGYQVESQNDGAKMTKSDDNQTMNINLPDDLPILYTDMVNVVSNKYGVVFNFVQGVGPNGQPTVVSRVGMSHDHAKSVLEVLQKSLERPKDKN
jgi:transcriptional regulator with XRE-family HTH domain